MYIDIYYIYRSKGTGFDSCFDSFFWEDKFFIRFFKTSLLRRYFKCFKKFVTILPPSLRTSADYVCSQHLHENFYKSVLKNLWTFFAKCFHHENSAKKSVQNLFLNSYPKPHFLWTQITGSDPVAWPCSVWLTACEQLVSQHDKASFSRAF